ncbi:uncharacterized protein LOC123504622 isoform X2 [Portunus trituberculatus]|uniref:uncharacterized protein LOC123504622 isoform X2 n=1 Tax=Portunus trituberculatus TaxID=210409 RepID=UPI001E1CB735|nr:uncharacterized protein LOC123504622 isoform X2 [Portunus trituberculatus]
MSSGNTSYQNPVRGKGEDHIGLLAIAVAVLGTLVGVGLLVGSVWACVVCTKIFYRQRKRHKRQKLGIDGFPPQPREMVELGHIPRLPRSADNGPYSINNTGISRSIGIHTSQSAERFPAVPVPKSWTPSPPFAGKHGQTSMYYRKHSSHIPQKNKQERQARNIKTHSHLKKNIPNNTKGSTSVYHPPYNTHASDVWSVQPAFSNSSSSQSLCSSHPPPEEVDQHFHRNTCSGKNRQTRWRESSMYNKEPFGKCSRHRKKVHAHVHSHKFNECNYGKSNLDEGTEAPDACSSYRDSPQSSHNLISLSQHQQQSHPSRAEASNNYVSYTNPVCSEISDIQKNSAVSSSISRQNMIQIIPKEKRQERSSKYHETPPDPTQSLISTKSRRLWRESCGFKNEVLPKEHTSFHGSGPCWIHHSQPTQRQHRQTEPPPDPLSELSILRETYEQEAFQNIARKYGFCETCGCEISLMQQHEGACGAGRSCVQFKDCDERCESSVDSTPSMSWDNLTPEPTAALTNTQPLQAVSGTNLTHNDKVPSSFAHHLPCSV